MAPGFEPVFSGSGGGSGGLLASLGLQRPALQQPAKPSLRKTPGQPDTTFYDRLGAGDPQAEATLRRVLADVRTTSLEGRELIERGWWQKLLYINGRQWIFYTSRGGWQDKRMARWIPRPVTNICAETVQSIRAMTAGVEPSARIRPNGQDPKNVLTADRCDQLEPAINEEHQMQTRWFEADFWCPALGTVFLHPYWDRDDGTHTEFVQSQQCPRCQFLAHPLDLTEGVLPGCPQCGTPSDQFVPAVQPDGSPEGTQEIVGRGRTEVVSPLEILIPVYFQRWEDVDRLIRLTWRPKSYFEGRPYFDKIQFRSTPADRSLQMYRALAMMTDLTTAPYQGVGATSSRVEGTIEAELWVKPNAEYPEGLWCRSVGGQHGEAYILRDEERGIVPGPIPFRDNKNKPLWLWVYLPFEETGGRLWAKSALDPVIPKQDQINRNDSMVELIMQRMANPIWLEPKGAEVQRFTGEPGLIVRYQVVAGTNAKPERMDGITPNATFFTLRAQYFQDAERLSGTQDVMKGIQPSGVEAFSALNLLVERSQSRFTSLFKARGRAYRDWLALALELERVYGPRERTRPIMGDSQSWMFQTFQKADLQGAISVLIEDGTETPKTALGKRAALQQLQQLGFRFDDPDKAYAVFQLTGMTDLAPSLSAQVTAAQTEFELYERWVSGGRLDPATQQPAQPTMSQGPDGQPKVGETPGNPLVVRPWQQHLVYLQQLDRWASTDRIRELVATDPQALQEITVCRTQHVVAKDNPFGLPIPPAPPQPQPDKPKTSISLKGPDLHDPLVDELLQREGIDIQPIAPAPAHPYAPVNGRAPAGGSAQTMVNSNRESGAVDTLPGAAPGGGNMGAPA